MKYQKYTAYDYLLEYLDNNGINDWIKKVIITYLNSQGNVNESEKENLVLEWMNQDISPIKLSNQYKTISEYSNVTLNTLKHVSGVNALADNQEIKFNKDVTVLYGLNGSGKSSYFRIIQAMIGNIVSSELKPNIYLERPENVNVELSYFLNGKQVDVNCWNNSGLVSGLKPIRVFDSNYAYSFLKKRNSDDLLVLPYHLEIFSEIINLIDDLKKEAINRLEEQLKDIQQPSREQLTDEIITILSKDKFEEKDSSYILKISDSFNKKSVEYLSSLEENYSTLIETNFNDKKQLNRITQQEYKRADEVYLSYIKKWVLNFNNYHNLYKEREKYEELSNKRKNTLTVLKEIPGTDSDTWKSFLKYGNKYVQENELNECPYCHRAYNDEALLLVSAYAEFLNNDIETNLSEINLKIEKIANDNLISEIVDELTTVEHIDEEIQATINDWLSNIKNTREQLKGSIDEKFDIEPLDISLTDVQDKIKKLTDELKMQNSEYVKSDEKKAENLEKLKIEIKNEKCKKSVCEQFSIIQTYMNNKNEINKIIDSITKLSTNNISKISKKAHKELLSDQLQQQFEDNLELLGIKGKRIELIGKNNKGTQQTELVMKSHKDIASILSEGEQKIVSVALFMAEIIVSKNKSTIIMDDPVNSLDHKMMDKFVDMILQLENQVIILTHNRMFIDLMHGSRYGHFCKTFDTACNNKKGKHIYVYQTTAESNNEKGVIIRKFKLSSEDYLNEIDELIKKSPFNEFDSVCAKMRKTIDCLIDEVIFKNQTPRKFSIKGNAQGIEWEKLKQLGNDPELVDTMKSIYDRISSSNMHIGQISRENPLDKEELIELFNKLKKIC